MNVLWMTWKDARHPAAGGAELVASELIKRLHRDGHQVTVLTCRYPGATHRETVNGIHIIRVGRNRYSHSFQALSYYLRHLRGKFDCLIEEVNGGAPYFSVFFAGRARRFMLYHQLARINWLYEIKRPFGYMGYYVLVPLATKLATFAQAPVITVSESTKHELAKHGFDPTQTHIISEGLEMNPVPSLMAIKKYTRPTILSLGAMRSMKRTLDQVRAFEFAKKRIPQLELKIAGSSETEYGQKVLAAIARSPFKDSIEYLGRIGMEDKITVMQRSHILVQTAIEEGWGLTITEAASQGTPAVAYDVSGLRDSVLNGRTGITTDENPKALAESIVALLGDKLTYDAMRHEGWEWSKHITFDQSYADFMRILESA